MPLDTVPWDVVDYLDSEDAISGYLSAVLEENDPKLLVAALGDVARAKGMAGIASETGLSRESLYKSLSQEGNPVSQQSSKSSMPLVSNWKFARNP